MIIRPPVRAGRVVNPHIVVPEDEGILVAGAAVTLVVEDDTPVYRKSSCRLNGDGGDNFYGIVDQDTAPGDSPAVWTGRGALVTPLVVEGDLVPHMPVFLSATPGKVTCLPPDGTEGFPTVTLQVGVALSATLMVLKPDLGIL